MLTIRKADSSVASAVAMLAQQLWPHHETAQLQEEFEPLLADANVAVFLAFSDEEVAGFAQCQLRNDYVEGTSSSPVGYLEGIFVTPAYQKQGIARALLAACENWAKQRGCSEFASDCELDNRDSLLFHLNVGFEEANRIICFTKKL